MQVFIKGVWIELTAAQVEKIERNERKIKRAKNSFVKALRHFGFKKIKDLPDSYDHSYYDWYAQINSHGGWQDVFMAGNGLKHGGFPGGWIYGSTKEIIEALTAAMENINNNDAGFIRK